MRLKINNIEIIVLIMVLYIVYLCCNKWTPMVVDDCSYAATGHTAAAIWERQSLDYMTWSGRVVAHSVAQFWGGIAGKKLFNFFNPLAMCMLIWLIGRGCGDCHKARPLTVALAALLMWFLAPDQYVTQFMIAGSMNYIWASVLVLLFLFYFNRPSSRAYNGWHIAALTLFALLAGCWSEMYAVCTIPAGAIWLWLNRKEISFDRRKIAMLTAYCIGAAFVVLAPGNFARMHGLTTDVTHTTPMATRIVNVIVFVISSPLLWLWVLIVILWFVQKKKCLHFWRTNCFWWVATICSIGFCVFSGATWPRTHFPAYIFTFVLLVRFTLLLPLKEWVDHAVTVAILTSISIDFVSERRTLHAQYIAVEQVKESVTNGTLPIWEEITPSRKSIANSCFSSYSDNWRNIAFAQYHHLPPFGVVSREVMEVVEKASSDSIFETKHYLVRLLPARDDSVRAIHVIYSDTLLYTYPSKLARLASSVGLPMKDRYYTTKEEAPFEGFLLKHQQGLEITLPATGSDESIDQFGILRLPQATYVYYPSHYTHLGNLDAIRTETELF